jgi:hypothetical protein
MGAQMPLAAIPAAIAAMSASTAIAGAAVIGAGATIYASNKAASATKQASDKAIAAQEKAVSQQADLSAPYRGLGESAIPQYQQLLGLTPGADKASIMQTLQNLPGYEFTKTQGLEATKAQAAAMGLGLSGNTLKALDEYGSGLANQTYGQRVNELAGAVGQGQAAAAGQAANIGQAASNVGNIAIGQGTNMGNIAMGQTAGVTGAFNNALNQYTLQNTLKGLGGAGSGGGASLGNIVPPAVSLDYGSLGFGK